MFVLLPTINYPLLSSLLDTMCDYISALLVTFQKRGIHLYLGHPRPSKFNSLKVVRETRSYFVCYIFGIRAPSGILGGLQGATLTVSRVFHVRNSRYAGFGIQTDQRPQASSSNFKLQAPRSEHDILLQSVTGALFFQPLIRSRPPCYTDRAHRRLVTSLTPRLPY